MATVYITALNKCPVACGTPLVFLKYARENILLYYCFSCEAIFNGFLDDPRDKRCRDFTPSDFEKGELELATPQDIRSLSCSSFFAADDLGEGVFTNEYYIARLSKHLGDKISMPEAPL